ncbi:MAG: histidine phosphatase family protein [Candidatus Amulumruptor caecigallinarius]|nr:histidine phosphatase family protein [Candidatus Amulumruptor caecigallinarius]
MNLSIATVIASLLLPFITIAGETKCDSILPENLDGSMAIYNFRDCSPMPVYPDSLKPVKVIYVARHGARFLSSRKKVCKIERALLDARAAGNISDKGIEFLNYLETVESANRNKWGELSPLGVAEERELAGEMVKIFPPLQKMPLKLEGKATFVPRAVMTMYEFMHGLNLVNDNISSSTSQGHMYSRLLYFFSVDSAFAQYRAEGNWVPVYDEYVTENVPSAPAAMLFKNHSELSDAHLKKLTMEMYEVMKGNRAASLPPPTTAMMGEEDYRQCYLASNLQHYLRNNITPLSHIAAEAVTPLLQQIIADAETPADGGDTSLFGYFGHAETLLPLLSLMKIPGCFALPLDYKDLADTWRIEDITPLAANLAIVILKSESGKEYASLRLNGRDINPLQLSDDTDLDPGFSYGTVIVPWSELRTFWQHQINSYK